VVDALRAHRARQAAEKLAIGEAWRHDAGLVFTTPIGTPLDPENFGHTVPRICEQAGLGRWTLHELRHSCASLLLAMGVPLEVVSETLGHSSIRVTKDVYGHLLAPARAAAADAMARALWSKENDSQEEALATHLATRPEADDPKKPLTRENGCRRSSSTRASSTAGIWWGTVLGRCDRSARASMPPVSYRAIHR
jgi:hypothetical protein